MGGDFPPFVAFREQFGFIPNLFLAQTLLPEVIEAEARLLTTVLFKQHRLSRVQKECILFLLAAAADNIYCCTSHRQMLLILGLAEERVDRILADYREAELSSQNRALMAFALKLGAAGSLAEARAQGWDEEALRETVLIVGVGNFLCTLSTALDAVPDFPSVSIPVPAVLLRDKPAVGEGLEPSLSVMESAAQSPDEFPPFAVLREAFGFVPNVFRLQGGAPDILEAEAGLVRAILLPERFLSREQKVGILAGSSQIHEFTEDQRVEAAAVNALASFLTTLHDGLGCVPDFPLGPGYVPEQKKPHLSPRDSRHTDVILPPDPDAAWVTRVQGGEVDAFEELMVRHNRRVYRTLLSILGNPEDARDAMQDTFLKAFQNLSHFQGRSKFSTWLVSIASNTGIQRLRDRRNLESLDEREFESEERFRPRQVQAWTENPEQLYSQTERRSLVEEGVMKLPAKYRVVVMLRDVEQLPAEEAAAALGLGIPALKARLLRGRLMLREALAPHFTKGAKGVAP